MALLAGMVGKGVSKGLPSGRTLSATRNLATGGLREGRSGFRDAATLKTRHGDSCRA